MFIRAEDISNVEAEAGVIASVLLKPELTFNSEQLLPNHFTNPENAYIYYAVCELAKKNVEKVDVYNITNILNARRGTTQVCDEINGIVTIQSLQELFDNAKLIARSTPEDYKVVVSAVMDAAFRRNTYEKLVACERLCLNGTEGSIEQQIYSTLDGVMMEFSTANEVPQYKDVVDMYWDRIKSRQAPGGNGAIPFPFEALNDYVMIEPGELVVFCGAMKQGKSALLLNIAAHLLRNDQSVLYLDSELNSELFTCRLLSHLTQIEFRRIRTGRYTEEEELRILRAKDWLKTRKFTHIYMPIFDEKTIYTTVKKVYHTQGISVAIIDYFKSGDSVDAYENYAKLGNLTDLFKNELCGGMGIAGIGAAQATTSGKVADSQRIARNASSIVMLGNKTPEEIAQDGAECGNRKLFVKFNRNGSQMSDGEWIDLNFSGDTLLFTQAEQHCPVEPY